jgi:hypothetical protein
MGGVSALGVASPLLLGQPPPPRPAPLQAGRYAPAPRRCARPTARRRARGGGRLARGAGRRPAGTPAAGRGAGRRGARRARRGAPPAARCASRRTRGRGGGRTAPAGSLGCGRPLGGPAARRRPAPPGRAARRGNRALGARTALDAPSASRARSGSAPRAAACQKTSSSAPGEMRSVTGWIDGEPRPPPLPLVAPAVTPARPPPPGPRALDREQAPAESLPPLESDMARLGAGRGGSYAAGGHGDGGVGRGRHLVFMRPNDTGRPKGCVPNPAGHRDWRGRGAARGLARRDGAPSPLLGRGSPIGCRRSAAAATAAAAALALW